MNRFTKLALIVLAGSASLFATPIMIQFKGQTFDIAGGGQFAARLSTDVTDISTYCVDFNNYINPSGTYNVNVSTLGDLSNTRYGTTSASAFTFQNAGGKSLGDAGQRYSEAAWLISQFDTAPGANGNSRDIGIQSAIWNILDASGERHTQGDWQTWMTNAANSGGASNFRIITTTDVAGQSGSGRYHTGGQEMITLGGVPTISQTPEPQSAVMLGLGGLLIAAGVIRRRKLSAQV